ncbi:MAG: glucosaminidase domain-containing protein [Halofilum sp. (in: g-proteobacteria)]|nr:glucosaminidase domain-containing protein [Halofilum sp. (in: g-proteobacteria)]
MSHASHNGSEARRPVVTGLSALVVLLVAATLGVAQRGAAVPGAPAEARADVPNLESVADVSERKQRFFDFLRPIVAAENERIQAQRERVLRLLATLETGAEIAPADARWLDEMAARYRVKAKDPLAQARRLARKVDVIPPALAMAQAALESAWGTSRFAREANNLFGQWCFTPGCGLVPKRRPANARYEVEAFADAGASVRSYMHNLNSHPAYEPLREIRARARRDGQRPTGAALAAGLYNYAAIGHKYVEHIRAVIRRNGLGDSQSG